MKTIEELHGMAESELDGFPEGRYALEFHDEDDNGELAYAFFTIDADGDMWYNGYASKRVQEPGTADEIVCWEGTCATHGIMFCDAGELLHHPALRKWHCSIDAIVEVNENA